MPAGDRTGPVGQGPMTGRRLGYCVGDDTPGYMKGGGGGMGRGFGFRRGGGFGRGMGYGRGYGRGWGYGMPFPAFSPSYPWTTPMGKEEEIKLLKSQADALKRSQKDIEKRLSELDKENE